MPNGLKLFISIALALIALGVVFVDSGADNAGPNWFWRGGKDDGLKNLLTRENGKLRRLTKTFILLFFTLFLGALWLFVPTSQ